LSAAVSVLGFAVAVALVPGGGVGGVDTDEAVEESAAAVREAAGTEEAVAA
jgi:hypothetical protein